MNENGTIKAVSVVPSAYTKSQTRLFQSFGASERTLKWYGEEDISPTIMLGPMDGVDLGSILRKEGLKQFELFATKIMPEFGRTDDVPAEVAKYNFNR
ncbi:hypothetical protein [Mesobacillus harenae]|uniref:hypothetical protein n=1 Tax=Mesobacillus harenae TaxID=2213203 RepID=UPI0015805988|nr:hypothetical protein [Mesobacillus harenae]